MKVLSVAGDRMSILLDGSSTDQKYTVIEAVVRPDSGPPLHVHSREDESFTILEGEMTFIVGDETLVVRKGEHLFAPRGIPHRFHNRGTEDVVMLITVQPAGFEQFFEEVGHPLADRTTEPPPATEADIARIIATAPAYGMDILPPQS